MSKKPIPPDLDSDIDDEEYRPSFIELWHHPLELLMPKYPEHPPRDISDTGADDETDGEVQEGDISTIVSISRDSEYDRDDNWEYDKSSQELRVDVLLRDMFLLFEMIFQLFHMISVISS